MLMSHTGKTTLKLEQKVAFVPGAKSESWP